MRKNYWLFLIFLLISISVFQEAASAKQELFTGLIISWEENTENPSELLIRTREQRTGEWTKWYRIGPDEDREEWGESGMWNVESGKKETLFSTNLSTDFEYKSAAGITNVAIEKILSNREGEKTLLAGLDIPTKNPVILRRKWGADEEITFENIEEKKTQETNGNSLTDTNEQSEIEKEDPEIEKVITEDKSGKKYIWPLQYAKEVKFIVIHHTASVSNLENPKTAIQNIQYYHAVRRGWGDIGYNYVIDTQGRIYEGRKGGEKVIGGHSRPLNKVSIGIGILGNYEDNEVAAGVLRSLLGLIREKAALYKIPINGKTTYNGHAYPNVHGHSDNSATTCPGRFLKEKLPAFKTLITYAKRKEPHEEPEKYDFHDLEKRKLIVVPADQEKEFTIRLQNTGKKSWKTGTFLETSLDYSNDGIPKLFAKLQNKKVNPSGVAVFKGKFPATLNSGLKIPQVRLVINGSIRSKKSFPVPIMVEGLRATYQLIGRKDPPEIMKAGKTFAAWVMLKNTGNFTWKRDGKSLVRIGTLRSRDHYSIFSKMKKTRIAMLKEKEVKPGEAGTFLFRLKAPSEAGSYTEYFAPVVEHITWMEDQGMNFSVSVESKEKPIRVALSFNKKSARVRSNKGMNMESRVDGKVISQQFKKNEVVTAKVLKNGKYLVKTGTAEWRINSPPRFRAKENGILELVNFDNKPEWNGNINDNLFRGVLEVNNVDKKLTVINELPLEDYLKGIAEISNGDPEEKIKTIIIIARSYALYYRDTGTKFPGKPYHLDDDPDHTQKYVGYGLELRSPNIVHAVQETRGKVVTYNGKAVITPYFNQSDGRTRSAEEMWGWKNTPYLQSVPDTFCGSTELKGHGVGVSGCGATMLAKQGKKAEEIIKYYYKEVEIVMAEY